jgi:hypothetical protein
MLIRVRRQTGRLFLRFVHRRHQAARGGGGVTLMPKEWP